MEKTQGSPIRRIGYESWQRNLSVAMGNARFDSDIVSSLQDALNSTSSATLIEHFKWAIEQQTLAANTTLKGISTRQHERLIRIIEKGLPRDA